MNKLWLCIVFISLVYGLSTNRVEEISNAILNIPKETIVQTAKANPELFVNSLTSGPVEMLFANEENRKGDFMDIEKKIQIP